jgi:hypothetical protein
MRSSMEYGRGIGRQGAAAVKFEPAGLVCTIDLSLQSLVAVA